MDRSSFSSKSSRYHKSKTIWARELKFLDNAYPPPHVRYQVSGVTCHVSRVRCNVSGFTCQVYIYIYINIYFFLQSGGFNCWRVRYQWGLPHIVLLMHVHHHKIHKKIFMSSCVCFQMPNFSSLSGKMFLGLFNRIVWHFNPLSCRYFLEPLHWNKHWFAGFYYLFQSQLQCHQPLPWSQ